MEYSVRDIVRKIDTYWYGSLNESRDELGRLYVISEVNGDEYEIRDLITGGSSAWWHNNQLERIGRADKNIFDNLDFIQGKLHERNVSIDYIRTEYPKIPATSWLALFKKIGYDSAFNRCGEYFILSSDIQTLKPLFNAIFDGDLVRAFEKVNEVFKSNYRDFYHNSVEKFFKELYSEDKKERCE